MRIIVQRTFLEVVNEDSSKTMEAAERRALSAPVVPTRDDELHSGEQEEAPLRTRRMSDAPSSTDGSHDRAQQSKEAVTPADQDPKTTVVIRKIPSHWTRDQLTQHLNACGFAGQYDFLYLPIDFAKGRNFGYAFVNLVSMESAERIVAELDGLSWSEPGEGHAVVNWSLTQGLDLHIERYRNSPVMHDMMQDECKPIVLQGGVRVDFPQPTRKVQRLRRLRTRCGSRGRGVHSSGWIPGGKDAPQATDEPSETATSCPTPTSNSCILLPGLSRTPSPGAGGTLSGTPFGGLARASSEASPSDPSDRSRSLALGIVVSTQPMRPVLAAASPLSPLLVQASPSLDREGASPAANGQRRGSAPALVDCSAAPVQSPLKKTSRASWADLQDDLDGGCSEASTEATQRTLSGHSSGALSSDGSERYSGALATRRRSTGKLGTMLAQGLMRDDGTGSMLTQGLTRDAGTGMAPGGGMMLAQGLMPALPEERPGSPILGSPKRGSPKVGSLVEVVGTYPSGAHAIVTNVNRTEDIYKVRLMHNGSPTRRLRTIQSRHIRLLCHTEAMQ